MLLLMSSCLLWGKVIRSNVDLPPRARPVPGRGYNQPELSGDRALPRNSIKKQHGPTIARLLSTRLTSPPKPQPSVRPVRSRVHAPEFEVSAVSDADC